MIANIMNEVFLFLTLTNDKGIKKKQQALCL